MSAMAHARQILKRSRQPRKKHIHLPSVHLRNGDDGFDYEEDLDIDGRRRDNVQRTIQLTAIKDGHVWFERSMRDVLSEEELTWFDEWLPVLMKDGDPDAQEIMEGRARLEFLRQCRIVSGNERACLACGCSETRTCSGGCIWATQNLCSRCVS